MRLSKKIHKKALKLDLEAASKDEVLEELVGLLCDAYKLKERDTILEAIRAREEKQSTGIGMGLAVPHAKTPVVDQLYVAFGRSKGGIDFDAIDGGSAHLFFILVSPRDVSGPHIKAIMFALYLTARGIIFSYLSGRHMIELMMAFPL